MKSGTPAGWSISLTSFALRSLCHLHAVFRILPIEVRLFHQTFAFHLQPELDDRRIKSVCDASQSFSMEASVCLPGRVPQKWSGLEPRQ